MRENPRDAHAVCLLLLVAPIGERDYVKTIRRR